MSAMLRIRAEGAEEVWENIPRNSKILIISAGVGLIAVAGITRYIRWKYFEHRKSSANGDVIKSYCSKCRKHSHQEPLGEARTPEALGAMGLESLEQAMHCWEDALDLMRSASEKSSLMSRSDIDVETAILNMLRNGQQLRESGKAIFASEESSATAEDGKDGEEGVRKRLGTDTDSFVSAEGAADVAQVAEVDQFPPPYAEHWPLYMTAVSILESKGIPCRAYRLQEFGCTSESDYLVRMHCVRLAFQQLVNQEDIRQWFINAGSQLLAALLIRAGRDPKDAVQAYDDLMLYVLEPLNAADIEKELKSKGIVCVTLYDVFIDYVLMDAFEDLSNPPTTVVAVIQNRWLTDGFKETALATAVWSLIKAKKTFLQQSNGFFAHYYCLAEHLVPVFAWGFLGTNQDLNALCNFFKNEIEGLVRDMFDDQCTRYTTIEDMSTDIFNNIHARYDKVCQRLFL